METLHRASERRTDHAGNVKDINGDGKIDLRDAVTGNPTHSSMMHTSWDCSSMLLLSGTRADILRAATREILAPSTYSSTGWG